MEVFTIGFTKKTAAQFFGALGAAGIKRLVDVRLNNSSQLAGFTKRDDLAFFLRELCGVEYVHAPFLAPTPEILDSYRKDRNWDEYKRRFMELMAERKIESEIDRRLFEVRTVLLCSEPTAEKCHRRLVLEYLQERWEDLEIVHL